MDMDWGNGSSMDFSDDSRQTGVDWEENPQNMPSDQNGSDFAMDNIEVEKEEATGWQDAGSEGNSEFSENTNSAFGNDDESAQATPSAQDDWSGEAGDLENCSPLEFLEKAKQAIKDCEELAKNVASAKKEVEFAKKEYDDAEKEHSARKEKMLKARTAEVENIYEEKIQRIDVSLKTVKEQREAAKQKGIENRIKDETGPLYAEIKDQKKRLAAAVRKANAPSIMNLEMFYTLFKPDGIAEIAVLMTAFLLFFVLLPVLICLIQPIKTFPIYLLIWVADIALFGSIYYFIYNKTIGKYPDTVQVGREVWTIVKGKEAEINKITSSINADKDESCYNLSEYDQKISSAEAERQDIIDQKRDALDEFEQGEKLRLMEDIDMSDQAVIDGLKRAYDEANAKKEELEAQEERKVFELSRNFEQKIGKAHMNLKDLDMMIDWIDAKEVSTITEAVIKLEK